MLKLNLTDNKTKLLKWTQLLNQLNTTLKTEQKLSEPQLNKSSLNLLYKSMFMKEKFIMFRIQLLEEYQLLDQFQYQPQYSTKYQLLEEFQFQYKRKEIKEWKSTTILMLTSKVDTIVLLLITQMMLLTLMKEMDMDTDIDMLEDMVKVDMEMVPPDMDMIREMLLLGFMEKDSIKLDTIRLIIMDWNQVWITLQKHGIRNRTINRNLKDSVLLNWPECWTVGKTKWVLTKKLMDTINIEP